jgi:hypothetical protein
MEVFGWFEIAVVECVVIELFGCELGFHGSGRCGSAVGDERSKD